MQGSGSGMYRPAPAVNQSHGPGSGSSGDVFGMPSAVSTDKVSDGAAHQDASTAKSGDAAEDTGVPAADGAAREQQAGGAAAVSPLDAEAILGHTRRNAGSGRHARASDLMPATIVGDHRLSIRAKTAQALMPQRFRLGMGPPPCITFVVSGQVNNIVCTMWLYFFMFVPLHPCAVLLSWTVKRSTGA